jgi:hypothetical protein
VLIVVGVIGGTVLVAVLGWIVYKKNKIRKEEQYIDELLRPTEDE